MLYYDPRDDLGLFLEFQEWSRHMTFKATAVDRTVSFWSAFVDRRRLQLVSKAYMLGTLRLSRDHSMASPYAIITARLLGPLVKDRSSNVCA